MGFKILNCIGKKNILFIINRKTLNRIYCLCCTIRLRHDKTCYWPSKELVNNKLSFFKYSSANNVLLKTSVSEYCSNVNDLDLENVNELEEGLSSVSLRGFLYPDSNDPIIISLNECSSAQEVFNVFDKHFNELNAEQISQVLLVLWDLQRQLYSNSYLMQFTQTNNFVLRSYLKQITSHESFRRLLYLIEQNFEKFSPNALTCSILYLSKMGINTNEPFFKTMVNKAELLISETNPGAYPLTALSRFTIAIGQKFNMDLWSKLTLISVFPHIKHYLGECKTTEELRLLTICLFNSLLLVTDQMIKDYNDLILRFLEDGRLVDENGVSILVKSITILNPPSIHNNPYFKTVIWMMQELAKNVDKVQYFGQYVQLQKAFMYHMEPANLRNALKKCCAKWLEMSGGEVSQLSPGMLYCIVMNTAYNKKHKYSEVATQLIDSADSVSDLFLLTNSGMRVVVHDSNNLWPNMIKFVTASNNCDIAISVSYRYFEMTAMTKDPWFEREMLPILASYAGHNDIIEMSRLAQLAMFIFAFTSSDRKPENLILPTLLDSLFKRIFENMGQFDVYDVSCLSRGTSNVLKQGKMTDQLHNYVKLDNELNARCLQILEEQPNISLYDLNMVCRSYINRGGGSRRSKLLNEIIERYKNVEFHELSSRSLRNTVYNVMSANCYIPELNELLVKYIVENKDLISGSTVSKLVHGFYVLGYTPENEEFFKAVIEVIIRDADMMAGLVLLQSALALSSFNHLPTSLISYIFDVHFLDDLDEEIKHGYSKLKYPFRVRKCLMELNRSVCLDYPEADIPWFHAKFCQQEAALLESKNRTPFSKDVFETLSVIAGDQKLVLRDVHSLYGYRIDFHLCLNKENKIVAPEKGVEPFSKVAVLLNPHSDWTLNFRNLKGPVQMKRRHLEMLGYRVVLVDETIWNSMFMTEPRAKFNYLMELLRPP